MDKKIIAGAVFSCVISLVIGFYAGIYYQQKKQPRFTRDFENGTSNVGVGRSFPEGFVRPEGLPGDMPFPRDGSGMFRER